MLAKYCRELKLGLDYLCQAYDSDPTHPVVLSLLAQVCLVRGDFDKVGSKPTCLHPGLASASCLPREWCQGAEVLVSVGALWGSWEGNGHCAGVLAEVLACLWLGLARVCCRPPLSFTCSCMCVRL